LINLEPIFITTSPELRELIARLRDEPAMAVDTESNSLYVYFERVCLLQISVPGADYLVDPLAPLDLTPLGTLFADPSHEKVFHAAEYDVICLRRDFGWSFANLFDTMLAARILGWPRYGLGDILEERFGISQNKRFQRANWGIRPLSDEQIHYAALDTHFLLDLWAQQLAELRARGREAEARESFVAVAQSQRDKSAFDPEGFWRVKGSMDLDPKGRAVLKALYQFRDEEARRQNRPPFKVLSDQILVQLSRVRPTSRQELATIRGLQPWQRHRYGEGLLAAVQQGLQSLIPQPPRSTGRPANAVLDRLRALRGWRKEQAAQRGVEPDVILSNDVLSALAHQPPRSLAELSEMGLLGPWRLEAYGAEIIAVLKKVSSRRYKGNISTSS